MIPGHGSIATRFEDEYAWPPTSRKSAPFKPRPGPEAPCYAFDSLAGVKSVRSLFEDTLIKESAHRALVISEHPTHLGIGITRSPQGQYLYTAVTYVQINSTRVIASLEDEFKGLTSRESRAASREV